MFKFLPLGKAWLDLTQHTPQLTDQQQSQQTEHWANKNINTVWTIIDWQKLKRIEINKINMLKKISDGICPFDSAHQFRCQSFSFSFCLFSSPFSLIFTENMLALTQKSSKCYWCGDLCIRSIFDSIELGEFEAHKHIYIFVILMNDFHWLNLIWEITLHRMNFPTHRHRIGWCLRALLWGGNIWPRKCHSCRSFSSAPFLFHISLLPLPSFRIGKAKRRRSCTQFERCLLLSYFFCHSRIWQFFVIFFFILFFTSVAVFGACRVCWRTANEWRELEREMNKRKKAVYSIIIVLLLVWGTYDHDDYNSCSIF